MEPRTDLMFGDWLPGCTVDTEQCWAYWDSTSCEIENPV